MNKYLIIKDPETGRYYTNDYDGYWSKYQNEAHFFVDEIEIQKILQNWNKNDYKNPFEDYITIIIETIYKIK